MKVMKEEKQNQQVLIKYHQDHMLFFNCIIKVLKNKKIIIKKELKDLQNFL